MMRHWVLLAAVMSAVVARAETTPFVVEWPREGTSPVSVAGLLEAPAGKQGFIRSAGGHTVYPDGRRFRIWGVNLTVKACVPEKAEAPIIAERMAQLGINGVRFHMLDTPASWGGLIAANREDTRALDEGALDKFDFFVAELKKRGIYTNLNLNVARRFKAGDGVREAEFLGFAKASTLFDPRLIELQKEYARQLLTHKNAYTGNEYRNEPAVAIVELLNENSLIEAWYTDRLLGKNTSPKSGTWSDIPPSYGKLLTEMYNAWLKKNLSPEALAAVRKGAGVAEGQLVPRLEPKELATAPADRFNAEAAFLMSVEAGFIRDMGTFLREEIGVKPLLVANSDHNHFRTGYPVVAATSLLDIVDTHVYWQHPNYIENAPKISGHQQFTIPNTPMVDDPLHSTVVNLSRSAMAGKPLTVSEVNHPFPAEYAAEGVPVLAAYAALQDWDGIYLYTLAHQPILSHPAAMKGHFDYSPDPVKMAQTPVGAMLFLRGDVKAAQKTFARSYSKQQVVDSIRLSWKERPYYTPGFPLAMPLQHAMRVASLDGEPTQKYEASETSPIRSETGELAWHYGPKRTGLVVIDTPRSQGLIGFCTARPAETANLKAELATEFAAITLQALDGKAIGESAKLLLAAGSRMENTDQRWNEKRTGLEDWGKEPTRIEVVKGKVVLKNLTGAKKVVVQALDGAGRATGAAVAATRSGEGWVAPIGETVTTWYVVSVER